MPTPTTALYLNRTVPAATGGDQNVVFQSDGATPEQSVTAYPQRALKSAGGVYTFGTTRPDGVTLDILADGTMFAIGGGSTGNAIACVEPSGAKDGSNTIFTLPAPVASGTGYLLVRNGVLQRQIGGHAEYAVSGSQITVVTPLAPDDWIEFYYTAAS